jgi:hypothetical protein
MVVLVDRLGYLLLVVCMVVAEAETLVSVPVLERMAQFV